MPRLLFALLLASCSQSHHGADLGSTSENDAGDASVSLDGSATLDGSSIPDAADAAPDFAVAIVPAFYVAPDGDDSNAGTLAKPFLTLTKAQSAMETSSVKTTYLRAGTYPFTSTLELTTADNGETWSYYPPDGVLSAILDGKNGGNYVNLIDFGASVSDVTIDGLTMQNVDQFAISHDDGSTNVTHIIIKNNDIGFNTYTANFSTIVGFNGHVDCQIINNYVHDTQSEGIGSDAYQAGLQAQGLLIAGNVVLRTVQSVPDGGGIYSQIYNNYVVPSTNPNIIENNFVRDYGSSVDTGGRDHAIYLDEGANGFVVRGNVLGPPYAAKNAIGTAMIVDGYDNQFTGNIIDLGTSGQVVTGFWYYLVNASFKPIGNTFSGNIVISNYTNDTSSGPSTSVSGDYTYVVSNDSTASHYTIANNLYYNYGGGPTKAAGNLVSDSSPIIGVNPQFVSGTVDYALPSSSPVYGAPLKFAAITGGWGPPGFALPSGTAPSY